MSLFEELRRRNVFRVGIAYAVAAWLVLQIADVLIDNIGAPDWVFPTLLMVLGLGFPLALIFAWAFELTPEGIKRESEVDRSESVTRKTGQKLNIAVMVMLALIAGYFIWESRFKAPASDEAKPATQVAAGPDTPVAPGAATEPPGPAIDQNAIAVLPFANRSNIEEDLFFTDGIHDDLLTQLAKIGELKVISRTSVMEYRDTTKKIPEIAAELGVGKILEGGVQRAGDRVRINAQLIDVNTDQHLWAETFNREMTIDNIFDIQSEITTQIVTAVKGELSDAERATLTNRPTDNLDAWEAFLHARAIVGETDYGADKYQRAEPFALESVRLDPQFAEAWAQLAGIQMQGIWIGYANTEAQREAARRSLSRAESLDPDNPEVIAARADYHYRIEVDYEAALARVEKALELAPGDAKMHRDRGLSLRRLGRWEESVAAFERSLALDPLNGFVAATQVETLVMMNAWERVEPLTDFWLRRSPDSTDLLSYKAQAMINDRGATDEAWNLLEAANVEGRGRGAGAQIELAMMRRDWDRAIELIEVPGDIGAPIELFHRTRERSLAMVHALKGDEETARGYLEEHFRTLRSAEPVGRLAEGLLNISLAEAFAWVGDGDRAVEYANLAAEQVPLEVDHVFGQQVHNLRIWVLAKAGQRDIALELIDAKLDQPEGLNRWTLHLDPTWDFFRDDPRFNELVRPEGVEPEPFRRLGDGT
ncbi:MAG: tetratricopeptide repeat protein [Xanthomonadales bacterium]|jgi:TolB-like protein|nr:tetratricopeptide repeat protein [Xanthomonadales bacterium]